MSDFSERIIGLYERHAVEWDADRQNSYWNDKRWHDRFIETLPQGARVLDLGCGSGSPVARHLVDQGLKITGINGSARMIALAAGRLPTQEWIVSDMRSLSLGRQFNGILAWDSFFHLNPRSQRQMFAVFARHAGPGTMLMFNTGPAHGEAIGSYRGDPLYHASLDADEYEALLNRVGFDVIAHAINDAEAGGRTVWLARSPVRS
ncbi:MAG: class I SAM-dependent methyltransferase [Rhodomicrobium sp.]